MKRKKWNHMYMIEKIRIAMPMMTGIIHSSRFRIYLPIHSPFPAPCRRRSRRRTVLPSERPRPGADTRGGTAGFAVPPPLVQ